MRLLPSLLLCCVAGLPVPALAQASSSQAPADQNSTPMSSADTLKLIVAGCMQVIGGDARLIPASAQNVGGLF